MPKDSQDKSKSKYPGKSDRALERVEKRAERKGRGGNSRWDAFHGKGGALAGGGYVLKEEQEDALGDQVEQKELTKRFINSIFPEYEKVFEVGGIALDAIKGKNLSERGGFLTEKLSELAVDCVLEMDPFVIETNEELESVLQALQEKLLEMGFIESAGMRP